MATGIEMLGQMGTDQSLAGPVQGGNMVVKPDQVPVGGAAMLSKALRRQADKGVGGMYVLPEQQDQTPEFMKIAKSNVMRDINGQRNQYPMNYAENEGGIIPMLPRNLKTAPGADETTLAYITPEEQAILGLLNPGTPHMGPEQVPSYDSYDYGVQTTSEDWMGYDTGKDEGPKAYEQARERAATDKSYAEQYGGGTQQQAQAEIAKEKAQGGGKIQDYAKAAGVSDIFDTSTYGDSSKTAQDRAEQNKVDEKLNEERIEAEKELKEAEASGKKNLITKAKDKLSKILDSIKSTAKSLLSDDDDGRYSDIERDYRLKKLREKYPNISEKDFHRLFVEPGANPTIMGSLGDFLSKPKPDQMTDENYMAIMEDARKLGGVSGMSGTGGDIDDFWMDQYAYEHGPIMAEGLKDLPPAEREAILKDSDSFKDYMKTMSSGFKGKEEYAGSEAQRRADKADYYGGTMPQTSGGLEQLAGERTFTNADMANMTAEQKGKAKAFNQKVFNARETANRDKADHGQGRRPQFMDTVEEEVIETPTGVVDEEAQTMAYTGPRTGGVETQVPLQKRFKTDPTQDVAQYTTTPRTQEDIYKYMTQGTTGEGIGLEPFSEYQKRRRKALGLEPLGLWS